MIFKDSLPNKKMEEGIIQLADNNIIIIILNLIQLLFFYNKNSKTRYNVREETERPLKRSHAHF